MLENAANIAVEEKSEDQAGSRAARLEAALQYAALGWKIFPIHVPISGGRCSCHKADCKHQGKHPRIKDWQHLASSDPDQIRKWFQAWNCNIGLACGDLHALDIDPRHGGSIAALGLSDEELQTPTTITGGGGFHLFFGVADGMKFSNSPGNLPKGIDSRGKGGQLVLPPSLHTSGNIYEWALGKSPFEIPPRLLPHRIIEMLSRKVPSTSVRDIALVRETAFLEGERNQGLASLAGSMRRRGAEEPTILAALLSENALRCDPPLSEEEVIRIAASISKYSPDQVCSPGPIDLLAVATVSASPTETIGMTAKEFLAINLPQPSWFMEGLIRESSLALVAGGAKSHKSLFTTQGALSLVSGADFLGLYHVTKARRVAIIQYENSAPAFQERIKKMSAALGINDPDVFERFHLLTPIPGKQVGMPRLDDPAGLAVIVKFIEQSKPELLIIDPLRQACSADENDNSEMGRIFQVLLGIRDRFQITVVVVHHLSKAGRERPSANGIRGASVIFDSVDSLILLDRPDLKLTTTNVTVIHRDGGEVPDFSFSRIDSPTQLSLQHEGTRQEGKEATKDEQAANAVFAALQDAGGTLSNQELVQKLGRRWTEKGTAALLDREQIYRQGGGHGKPIEWGVKPPAWIDGDLAACAGANEGNCTTLQKQPGVRRGNFGDI